MTLIKEISEDLAVIVINNNKGPNFPLTKELWKGWNQFLGQSPTLQVSLQWRCSAGTPALAAHIAVVDLLLFICFSGWYQLQAGLWPAFFSRRRCVRGKTHPY